MLLFICYAFQTVNFLLFWYLFISMVSGQQIYSNTYYLTFFSWFTGPLAIGFAWFDKDISAETSLRYPMSYSVGRENWDLDLSALFQMLARSLVHAVICWVAVFYVSLPTQNNDIGVLGISIYLSVVWTPLLYQMMTGRTWTWLIFLGVFILLVAFPIVDCILDTIQEGTPLLFTEAANVAWPALFWSMTLMIAFEHSLVGYKILFHPTPIDALMEIDALPYYQPKNAIAAMAQGRRIIIPVGKIRDAMQRQFATRHQSILQKQPSGFVYEGADEPPQASL
jgi:magnesium-transporting ATPase (P-type)